MEAARGVAPAARPDEYWERIYPFRSDAGFACFCCKKRMLTLQASGESQAQESLCKLVRHERTVRRHTTARHVFDALEPVGYPDIGANIVTQATWEWLNHEAYDEARSKARAIGLSGRVKEHFLWTMGFISLYPEYEGAQILLDPFSYDDTCPDHILPVIESITAPRNRSVLKEPAPESLATPEDHIDIKPSGLVPDVELKICSTEISTFDERHPVYPRDSVEPRFNGDGRHTNERKEVDVMRFSNELAHNGLARGTVELNEKSWTRAPSTDIAMDSRANSVEIKREPVEYNDELMTLG